MKKYRFFLWILLFGAALAFAEEGIPEKPEAWVSDYAGVLSPEQISQLNARLNALEKRSSNQIFVAIFQKILEGHYLEDFVTRLFEKWRPGLKDKDNGLIVAVFIEDRKMRIEVGYGLEDVITDAQASTVIREYMAPYFRKGDYFGGISKALDVLIPAAEGKYKIPVKKKSSGEDDLFAIIVFLIIFIMIIRSFMGGGGSGMGTRRRGGIFFFPFFFGGGGSSGGFGGSSGGFGGGGFGGGFGGMSGGGGASGGW